MVYSIYCPSCSQRAVFDIIVDDPCPVCRMCGVPLVLPPTDELEVLRTPSLDYHWVPPPVFEAMRRSLFARPFCDQCRRDSAVAFTQCLDYHPRPGDVCEGCRSVYEVPPPYTTFPFDQPHWRRRGALEVMREALGLLRPVSECEPASGVVVKPPRPVAR